jgi:hypothetical protein
VTWVPSEPRRAHVDPSDEEEEQKRNQAEPPESDDEPQPGVAPLAGHLERLHSGLTPRGLPHRQLRHFGSRARIGRQCQGLTPEVLPVCFVAYQRVRFDPIQDVVQLLLRWLGRTSGRGLDAAACERQRQHPREQKSMPQVLKPKNPPRNPARTACHDRDAQHPKRDRDRRVRFVASVVGDLDVRRCWSGLAGRQRTR